MGSIKGRRRPHPRTANRTAIPQSVGRTPDGQFVTTPVEKRRADPAAAGQRRPTIYPK